MPALYTDGMDMPAYARPDSDTMIAGVIASLNGRSALSLRDDRGFTDRITLHRGTVILPTGAKLAEGMKVTVYGHPDGDVFAADEIDAPQDAADQDLPGVMPLTRALQTGKLTDDGYGYGPYGYGPYGGSGVFGFGFGSGGYGVYPICSPGYPTYPGCPSYTAPVIVVVPQPAAVASPIPAPPRTRRPLEYGRVPLQQPSFATPQRIPSAQRMPMSAPRAPVMSAPRSAPVSPRAR